MLTCPPDRVACRDYGDRYEHAGSSVVSSVDWRLRHVVDECPKRNVIFEADSDFSEDVMARIVFKVCSVYPEVDLMTSEAEMQQRLIDRLTRELPGCSIVGAAGSSVQLRGSYNRPLNAPAHAFSLTVAPLSHFLRADLDRAIRGETNENRAAVIYRIESFLETGLLDVQPVGTTVIQIASLLNHIALMIGLASEEEVERRMRDYVKRYANRKELRVLYFRIGELVRSARVARALEMGRHFDVVWEQGIARIVLSSSLDRDFWGLRQFIELHHKLPISPLSATAAAGAASRTPLHLLKTYGRLMGVMRRGVYELKRWLPFYTQFSTMDVSRLFPSEMHVTPLISLEPTGSSLIWAENVARVLRSSKMPPRGLLLVVCPTRVVMMSLGRFLKIGAGDYVASLPVHICSTLAEVESLTGSRGHHLSHRPLVVLTTAALFEHWHMRHLGGAETLTVILGTASDNTPSLHAAFHFARPVVNVVTAPLEESSDSKPATPNDSGVDLDCGSSLSGSSYGGFSSDDENVMRAQALDRVQNRSHWASVFMREMWDKGVDYKAPIRSVEDERYERFAAWLRDEWTREGRGAETEMKQWKAVKMEQYRHK